MSSPLMREEPKPTIEPQRPTASLIRQFVRAGGSYGPACATAVPILFHQYPIDLDVGKRGEKISWLLQAVILCVPEALVLQESTLVKYVTTVSLNMTKLWERRVSHSPSKNRIRTKKQKHIAHSSLLICFVIFDPLSYIMHRFRKLSILSIKQHFEPVFVGQAHWRTKKKGMRIFEIRLRSFPRRPRTSRPPPSPSNSSTFFPSDIDIHYRRPQRSESDSTSSTSSYLIGRSRLWPRTYWETGRRGMNPPQHKNWFTSWFHRRALPRRKTNLPRRDETHRAFVVDAPEDTKPRLRRQLPLPAVFRASPGTRAQPASSRMDYTFTESLGRPRSGSRNRDVLEIREVCELHTEVPRTESRRSSPTSRVRPVSPGIDGSRGRSRSRFRAPREIYEVHEARPAEPDTRDINFRPPRERTPVVEREPRRSGRWISPIRQGRTRRTSPSSDRRSDPEPRLPRPIVRRPGARGTATREERWIMTSRIPSPITNNERSRAESKPRRTVQRSPQRQPSPEVIVERCPRAERPAIIHDGRRELSKRVIHRNYVGDAPRVRFQEPSHFVDPPVTRVFRRRRNRQERFIDERGPLDRWR